MFFPPVFSGPKWALCHRKKQQAAPETGSAVCGGSALFPLAETVNASLSDDGPVTVAFERTVRNETPERTKTDFRKIFLGAAAQNEAARAGISHIARANLYPNPVDAQGKIAGHVGRQARAGYRYSAPLPQRRRKTVCRPLPAFHPTSRLPLHSRARPFRFRCLTGFSAPTRPRHMPVCFP